MALEKLITSANGIIMNYHRIDHFETQSNKIIVYFKSYADKSYRLQEQEMQTKSDLANSLRQQISDEMLKIDTDEYDKELIQNLTDQVNELGFPNPVDLSIITRKFEYDLDTSSNFSYTAIYDWLKSEEIFKDATDSEDI